MMVNSWRVLLLTLTTLYHAIACYREDRDPPPGQRIDIGGYSLHLYHLHPSPINQGSPTLILDHSLGGIEGYLLIDSLAQLAPVCIYDRAGYGWSDSSPHPRTSQQIVQELDCLLNQANIQPPYILIGNSFGSYNMRLYAHQFPEKVMGVILTDGLHETGLLRLSWPLKLLKFLFWSGFIMSILGAFLGIIRILEKLHCFERLKPELKQFSLSQLQPIKRSFCRPKHWLTMSREIWHLNQSSRQLKNVALRPDLPVINIQAASFFKPSFWTALIPLQQANKCRQQMQEELQKMTAKNQVIAAKNSSHFVWVDEPEKMLEAVQMILEKEVNS